MKNKLPHALIAGCSLAGVLGIAIVDLGQSSPGQVTRVHSLVDDLDGGENCNACHGSWIESMGDACLDCHGIIEEHLELGSGLHGSMDPLQADRCATCHSEHHGASFAVINKQSFAQAGVPDPSQFDHNIVGFDMREGHLELDCTECHEFADSPLVPEGEHRYVGLSSSCASCHEDPHDGSMRQSCDNCHNQATFEGQHYNRHEEYFPLLGQHAESTCLDCHEPEGEHSLAAQMAGTAPDAQRACMECHDSPHGNAFLTGNALAAELSSEAVCASCHSPEQESFRSVQEHIGPEQHAHSGFLIRKPHAQLECAECHDSLEEDFGTRFPGRSPDDCIACHESPHGGQFKTNSPTENSCIECHARTHFEPNLITLESHGESAMVLDGSHAKLECYACHDQQDEHGSRQFNGTAGRCEDCHSDAHEDFFASRDDELQLHNQGTCANCHGTQAFDEVPASRFPHADWTSFELTGAHAENACESCHQLSPEANEHGRRFGMIEEHAGTEQNCKDCHNDPHEGSFDDDPRLATFQDREGCLRCHTETSFRQLPYGFLHGTWTGYRLFGKHQEAQCDSCHTPIRPDLVAANGGRSWSRAKGTQCSDCHEDPHASQFVQEGETDCARCHRAGAEFLDLAFRHNIDSRFPLDDSHAALACDACHRSVEVGDRDVVRYRPLGITCADCHGVKEDVLSKRRRGQ